MSLRNTGACMPSYVASTDSDIDISFESHNLIPMCVTVHHINTAYPSVFGFTHSLTSISRCKFSLIHLSICSFCGPISLKLSYSTRLDLHVVTPLASNKCGPGTEVVRTHTENAET
jgi:hypothetical protein